VTWSGKRVLVTGAGGFIGSHLAESLTRQGAETRAFVLYNSLGTREWLDASPLAKDMQVIAGDICDVDTVRRAMAGVDVVFHLAALIAIPYSYHAPHSYARTNVMGTMNVLQAAGDAGVSRIVHTSTSEVYGTAKYVPIDEAHPLQGQSPYSASKIGADKMAEAFHASFELPVVILRPFNTYGPRQSARAVIPSIITQCLESGALSLGNLSPTRDFTYVFDTVDGFLLAATAENAIGETINLGVGKEISINDLAAKIAALIGADVTIETDPQRLRPADSEVERLLSDNSRAGELLDWRPQVDLETGLARTIEWIKANPEAFRQGEYTV
jgi:NAD dependent epimerase/dehydratase